MQKTNDIFSPFFLTFRWILILGHRLDEGVWWVTVMLINCFSCRSTTRANWSDVRRPLPWLILAPTEKRIARYQSGLSGISMLPGNSDDVTAIISAWESAVVLSIEAQSQITVVWHNRRASEAGGHGVSGAAGVRTAELLGLCRTLTKVIAQQRTEWESSCSLKNWRLRGFLNIR